MLPSLRGAAFRRIPKWDWTQASYASQKELRGTKPAWRTTARCFLHVPKSDRPDYKVRLAYRLAAGVYTRFSRTHLSLALMPGILRQIEGD